MTEISSLEAMDPEKYIGPEISILGHHECHRCGLVLKNVKLLVAHLAEVHDDFRFRCKLCNQGFSRTAKLRDHLQKHNGNQRYKCDICEKVLSSANSLRGHKKTQHGPEQSSRTECKYCGEQCHSIQMLTEHVAKHPPVKCSRCKESFGTTDLFDTHVPCKVTVPSKDPSATYVNSNTLVSKENKTSGHTAIDRPQSGASSEELLVTNSPGEKRNLEISSGSIVTAHLPLETNLENKTEESYLISPGVVEVGQIETAKNDRCNDVNIEVITFQDSHEILEGTSPISLGDRPVTLTAAQTQICLGTNSENHHVIEGIGGQKGNHSNNVKFIPKGMTPCKYKCQICGVSTETVKLLVEHISSSHNESSFKCTTCSKGFPTQMKLKSHLEKEHKKPQKEEQTITGTKRFKCNICENAFPFQSSLRRHMKIHMDKKPVRVDDTDIPESNSETSSNTGLKKSKALTEKRNCFPKGKVPESKKSESIQTEHSLKAPARGRFKAKSTKKQKKSVSKPDIDQSTHDGKSNQEKHSEVKNSGKAKGEAPDTRKESSFSSAAKGVNKEVSHNDISMGSRTRDETHNKAGINVQKKAISTRSKCTAMISQQTANNSQPNIAGTAVVLSGKEVNDHQVCSSDATNANHESESGNMDGSEEKNTVRPPRMVKMHRYCSRCDKNFEDNAGHRAHIREHLREYFEKEGIKDSGAGKDCPICGGHYRRVDEKYDHIVKEHLNIDIYKCKQCAMLFNSRSRANTHTLARSCKQKLFVCNVCKLELKDEENLVQHMDQHAQLYPVKCTLCPWRFKKTYLATYHMLTHKKESDNKSYKCPLCDHVVTSTEALRKHKLTHKRDAIEPCSVCGLTLQSTRARILHEKSHAPKDPIKCSQCDKEFPTKAKLRYHMNEHQGVSYFRCIQCQSSFFGPKDLRNHLSQEGHGTEGSGDQMICMCAKCERMFASVDSLRDHVKSHAAAKEYLCSTCGRAFALPRYLTRHIRKVHGGNGEDEKDDPKKIGIEKIDNERTPYRCAFCKKMYTRKNVAREHVKCHLGHPNIICGVCGKGFYSTVTLKSHMRNHSDHKPHQCPTCGKAFRERAHLVIHARIHSDERPYACNICGFSFRQASAHKRHVLLHEGAEKFPCTICGRLLSTKIHLKNHLLIHVNTKPHSCKTCGKRFRIKPLLKAHSRIHQPIGNFPCNTCNKVFKHSHLLRVHRRRHKSVTCSVCENVFYDARALRVHMKGHEGAVLYTCDVCGKQFFREDMLRLHMNSHVTLRPYQCSQCPKGFLSQRDLKSHELSHSDPEFGCEECGKMFRYETGLKKHVAAVHAKKLQATEGVGSVDSAVDETVIAQTAAQLLERLTQNMVEVSTTESEVEPGLELVTTTATTVVGEQVVSDEAQESNENIIIVESGNYRYTCKGTMDDVLNSQSVDLQVIHAEEITETKENVPEENEAPESEENMVEETEVNDQQEVTDAFVSPEGQVVGEVQMLDLSQNVAVPEEPAPSSTVLTDEGGVALLKMEELKVGVVGENGQIQVCDTEVEEEQEGTVTYVVIEAGDEEENEGDAIEDLTQEIFSTESLSYVAVNPTSEGNTLPVTVPLPKIQPKPSQRQEIAMPPIRAQFTEGMTREEKIRALHTCQVCQKYFSLRSKLKSHLLSHSSDRPYTCSHCNVSFKTHGTLKKHVKAVHENIRDYGCQTCGKSFHEKGHLAVHMRTHSDEKPFVCNACGKCFRENGALKRHRMVHLDLRPHVCSYCGKQFREMAHLTVHVRSHTGERPFGCHFCDKAFSCVSTRKQHERLHTGARPYKCPYCDKCFIAHNRRQEHVNTIHLNMKSSKAKKDKPFVCLVCTKSYTSEQYLNAHLQKHGAVNITMV